MVYTDNEGNKKMEKLKLNKTYISFVPPKKLPILPHTTLYYLCIPPYITP
jgi:hypothetical protein